MSVCFEGIGGNVATFLVEEGCSLAGGEAVTVTGDGTVGLGSSGGWICGVAVSVEEDGCAGVQVDGFVRAAYTGSAPTVGVNELGVDGAGALCAVSGGGKYLVVSVDTAEQTCVVKL